MKIQELEQRVGIERATIRYYEKEGLVEPERNENGYRDYSEENAEELKKIRLLRQVGLSIGKIRSLQQGSGDFDKILSEQICSLTSQIAEQKRAQLLCQTLKNDNATYEDLDAEHYLGLLNELKIAEHVPTGNSFKEDLPEEIHPWRRYFARVLDYWLLNIAVNFVLVVLLRIRPLPGAFMNAIIAVLAGAAFIPVEAFMLSQWATTPGKFIFGIRIDSVQGGNLRFSQAFSRAGSVYAEGTFFRIPFLQIYSMLRQYCKLTGRSIRRFIRYDEVVNGPEEMPWDHESELTYNRWNWKRGVALAVLVVSAATVVTITATDAIRPRYRGSDLTIAQFAKNYNYYLELFDDETPIYDKLQPDGKKYPVPTNQIVVDLTSTDPLKVWEYQYTEEKGFLKAITIHNKWNVVLSVTPLDLAVNPSVSVLMAQNGMGLGEMAAFLKQLGSLQDRQAGSFTFQDTIQIEWSIQAQNCTSHNGTYYPFEEDTNATLEFWCTITLLN